MARKRGKVATGASLTLGAGVSKCGPCTSSISSMMELVNMHIPGPQPDLLKTPRETQGWSPEVCVFR